jgi:hypothetical protein
MSISITRIPNADSIAIGASINVDTVPTSRGWEDTNDQDDVIPAVRIDDGVRDARHAPGVLKDIFENGLKCYSIFKNI